MGDCTLADRSMAAKVKGETDTQPHIQKGPVLQIHPQGPELNTVMVAAGWPLLE